MKRDFDSHSKMIDEIEIVVYKKTSDQPNIFDEI